ncbi:MAG: uncharacterized protein JWR80_7515 [Bradyrhizobium sp.]|nr:uncharacterized protein [Bradyrhizobium sp.]
MSTDEYNLERFVSAQAPVYDEAIASLHGQDLDPAWMAFVFPRFLGCYHDVQSQPFAIGSIDEARAYLAHPVLGPRMRESLDALKWLSDCDPNTVLSDRDRRNLHSSLTLFGEATNEPLMRDMLAIWFGCRADETTMEQLDLRA